MAVENSNGRKGGPLPTRAKMEQALSLFEQKARTLRSALEIVDELDLETKRVTGRSMIARAIAIDDQRTGAPKPKIGRPRKDETGLTIAQRILAFLAAHPGSHHNYTINTGIGLTSNNGSIYGLEKKGLVERNDDGWIITLKGVQVSGSQEKDEAPPPVPKGQPGYTALALVNQRRQHAANVLAGMSKTEPSLDIGKLAGTLLRHGYVKQKGLGYVRTDKEFSIRKPRKSQAAEPATDASRREKTAALLAGMSPTEPSKAPGLSTSILLLHGYIKKKGDGYIRTAKPFAIDPREHR